MTMNTPRGYGGKAPEYQRKKRESVNVWTKEYLHQIVTDRMRNSKFIAVSNREPYIHWWGNGRLECMQPASGLTTALGPIMRASGGTWVAHGSGTGDREAVNALDHVMVPPDAPEYTLRRVWLPREVESRYYYGLANEGLWPLCHIAFHRPKFNRENWDAYRRANEIFAEAVLEEAGGNPAFVFIQDYHFGLLPRILKRANPKLTIAQFWHIPWPNRETFRAFPWKEELLDGMLGNDLLGFHLRYHCSNFLETIDRNVEALVDVDHGQVTRGGHVTAVRPFPISIDFEDHSRKARVSDSGDRTAEWWKEIGRVPEILGIGIDRIDYTKGIPERLAALESLFEEHPEYLGRLTFVQVGVPSRVAIPEYEGLNQRLTEQVNQLNRRWGRGTWKPVVFVRRHVDQKALIALHLVADFCVVSSLHDGMNLVAKEFVASRVDEDGVLILSSFTGAARELIDALRVNPFATDEIAAAMHTAITMPAAERHRRMARMREVVRNNNIYRWAGKIVNTLAGMEKAGDFDSLEETNELAMNAEVA
jgi:trehalose 6-phosphate synthase